MSSAALRNCKQCLQLRHSFLSLETPESSSNNIAFQSTADHPRTSKIQAYFLRH